MIVMRSQLQIESVEFSLELPALEPGQLIQLEQSLSALEYVIGTNAEDGKTLYIEVLIRSGDTVLLDQRRETIEKMIAGILDTKNLNTFLDQFRQ